MVKAVVCRCYLFKNNINEQLYVHSDRREYMGHILKHTTALKKECDMHCFSNYI